MKTLKNKIFVLSLVILSTVQIKAQNADSLLNSLTVGDKKPQRTLAIFKGSRVVFSQSTETNKLHDLNVIIRHNFGDIGGQFGGSHTLYGLDAANDIFIGFEYGITRKLQIGLGRSRENELYNLSLKYKLLEQYDDASSPISISLFGQAGLSARRSISIQDSSNLSTLYGRTSYFYQVIIARKFSERLSLQISPSYLYQVHPLNEFDHPRLYSLGIAGRLKITKRTALIADYQLVNSSFLGRVDQSVLGKSYFNPLGLGFEIETGGHVFTLQFVNTEYILENNFIPNTQKSWKSGGVRLAFAIGRTFTLYHSKKEGITDKSSIR